MRDVIKRILRRFPLLYRQSILSPLSVTWAYRLFLDRNPESSAVVQEKLCGPIKDIPNLRRDMILSAEFARNNPDLAPFPLQTIVITQLSCGKRLFVDLGDSGVSCPIVRGQYESDLLNVLPNLLQPGSTALDIGANIGFFSIHLAHLLGTSGRVFAFEPIRELAALLKKSIEENHLEQQITVEVAAVGDHDGHADILCVHNARNQGASYLVDDAANSCPTSHELRRVPVMALDSYEFPGRVGFIKLDIEGAEPLCIRGSSKLLHRDRPIVMSEVHPVQLNCVSHTTPGAYLKQFVESDYRCFLHGKSGFAPVRPDDAVKEVVTVVAVPSENESAQRSLRGAA